MKGRDQQVVSPFQGSDFCMNFSQGVALGFPLFVPSGRPISRGYPLETARNPLRKQQRCLVFELD